MTAPRSLVGMSESAKKRAARRIAMDRALAEYVMRHGPGRYGFSRIGQHERQVRAELHVGERLRPCRGCPMCSEGARIIEANFGWTRPRCDGSRVLPARRAL